MALTPSDFPWTPSLHIGGDLGAGVQRLTDATPNVLIGGGRLATELEEPEMHYRRVR